MATIGYSKPHYRLLSAKEIGDYKDHCRSKWMSAGISNVRETIPPYLYTLDIDDSENILKVIRYFQEKFNKTLVIRNKEYWVVTYPN